ncbi:hypothetical protein N181_15420 [Sinorhizobium fredii USDA 205]|nr:hypothetical protein N181_15420 [Sinorhizobium fredii USDA 205]
MPRRHAGSWNNRDGNQPLEPCLIQRRLRFVLEPLHEALKILLPAEV